MPSIAAYSAPHMVLSGLAVRHKNYGLIVDEISPALDMDPLAAFYFEEGETDHFDEYEIESAEEDSISTSKSVRTRKEVSTFQNSHAETIPVIVEEEAQLVGIDEINWGVLRVKGIVDRKREIKCHRRLSDASNYNNTVTVTNKWEAATVKQITTDVNDGRDALDNPDGNEEVLVLGNDVWRAVSENPNLIANVVPTLAVGQLTVEQVAALLKIDRVVVAKAKKTTKLKDNTTKVFLWDGFAALMHVPRVPSRQASPFQQTFRRKVRGLPVRVYTTPVDEGPDGGTRIKVSITEQTAHILNKDAGFLFQAPIT